MTTSPTPKKTRRGRPPSATLAEAFPEIAAQLVDPTLAHTLSRGSNETVLWQCELGHQWSARVYNRTNAKNRTGCPVCSGKQVLVGFNDIATTHPEAAALFADPELTLTTTGFSNKSIDMRCPQGHTWKAPPSRLTAQGSRCPYCSGRKPVAGVNDIATTHPELAQQMVDPDLATKLSSGSNKIVQWRCPVDNDHVWGAQPVDRTLKKSGCPHCSGRIVTPGVNDLATTHPNLASELADQSLATQISKGYGELVQWRCRVDPTHVWQSTVWNRVKGSGCGICANKQVLVGFNDIAHTQPHLVSKLLDPRDATRYTAGAGTPLTWKCDIDPDHTWEAPPYRFLSPRPPGCPMCYKSKRSAPEIQLLQVIQALLPDEEILTSRRDILGDGRELDIVIPGRGVAVEFNGVYWHSDAVLESNNYHRSKTQIAHEKGYHLIHVWEDDWFDRRELVLRAIAHRLGVTEHLDRVLPDTDHTLTERVAARTLTPTVIDGTRARAFWQANHLQGPVGSPHYFGLVDNTDAIRALLGVGGTNHGSRATAAPGVWDVQRYATRGIVAGGFTRLLAYAQRQLQVQGLPVTTWTSYSDDDISDGGMYHTAGFTVDRRQAPSYWYIGGRTGWRRVHRAQYMKQRFVTDPDLIYHDGWTEKQAAHANGLHRVYDAGKTRWVKHV